MSKLRDCAAFSEKIILQPAEVKLLVDYYEASEAAKKAESNPCLDCRHKEYRETPNGRR